MSENPNLYSNNADVKFPLIDTHTEDIPNDILTGLSLTVPPSIQPVLTCLRVGIGFVVVILEDLTNNIPIAYVLVEDPQPGLIYPLEMDVLGHGYVMFGPGALERQGYYSGQVSVALEDEVVISAPNMSTTYTIEINGLTYSLDNALKLLSANSLLNITIEGSNIFIDRNDDELDELSLVSFLDRDVKVNQDPLIYTIANTPPDENGNIDIDIIGCMEECAPVNSTDIDRGDEGAGDNISLPLDIYFPAQPNEDDPCAPSESSESSETPEEPSCQNIYKEVIYNENNNEVGTLYTHIDNSSSSSSE
jgi:hypothetical protein